MSHNISINDTLYNEIKEYCELNNINIPQFCNELLKKSLTELKYGDIPFGVIKTEPEIPQRLVANEIIPVKPMEEPKGLEILAKIEENKEKKEKITKKVRVLN